jgi:hypothetical protein
MPLMFQGWVRLMLLQKEKFLQLVTCQWEERRVEIFKITLSQELNDRDILISCKREELRELMLDDTETPHISPETNCVSFVGSRAFQVGDHRSCIETLPSYLNPRLISMIIEFMQEFQKQSCVLCS